MHGETVSEPDGSRVSVCYCGPHRAVVGSDFREYPQGVPVAVSAAVAASLVRRSDFCIAPLSVPDEFGVSE